MTHLLSPAVTIREFDETLSVIADNTTIAGFAGEFNWGPVEQIVRVDSIRSLENAFGLQGTSNTDFLCAANYLLYSNNLRVVRATGSGQLNASTSGTGVLIKNEAQYQASYANGEGSVGEFVAKFPGSKGNGLKVVMIDGASWEVSKTGYTSEAGSTTLTSTGLTDFNAGDEIWVGGVKVATIVSIGGATTATLDTAIILGDDSPATPAPFVIRSGFAKDFNHKPLTSVWASEHSSSGDELHILVLDGNGSFTGFANQILERYEFVSKASDAKLDNGESNYYKNVINARSKYIRWMDHPTGMTDWGQAAATAGAFVNLAGTYNKSLSGGANGTVADGNKISAYQVFLTAGADEIGVLFAGAASTALSNGVISVAESLKYVQACVSPEAADVVANAGDEVDDILAWKSAITSTDRAFCDSGWKIAYDQYNSRFVNLPLNPDVAGMLVKIESTVGISASPAQAGNSFVKNCVQLHFSPTEAERDVLYPNSVNPVVTFPGEGTVLFGDRTAIVRPSAFRYVGARRLFNLVERSLEKSSRGFLFSRNTQAQRTRYANAIRSFLSQFKDNEDLEDFRVVCDNTNNTPEMIAQQVLVADVYIKPVLSVNWILVNMHAVRSGASFTESVVTI